MEQTKAPDPIAPADELTDEDRADAVVAADDTGMLGGEQEIVNAEIEQALQQTD
ncbi:MAG TPA: hypothetical protein VIG46_01710 [Candidatus Baltobacteraceae bacterium]|jgi:hypothetical protein